MKETRARLLIVGCCLAIVSTLIFGVLSRGSQQAKAEEKGKTKTADEKSQPSVNAPNFTLKDLDGRDVSLSNFKNKKAVVLVFFATWCPHCVAETPHLIEFHRNYSEKSVILLGINIQQSLEVVKGFAKQHGVNYQLLLDGRGKASSAYNVYGIPLVVGIDVTGRIQYRGHSLPPPNDLDILVKKMTQGIEVKRG